MSDETINPKRIPESPRSDLLQWLRGELVGPGQSLWEGQGKAEVSIDVTRGKRFNAPKEAQMKPLAWRPTQDCPLQEVLLWESPKKKYGAGLLHPAPGSCDPRAGSDLAASIALGQTDTVGDARSGADIAGAPDDTAPELTDLDEIEDLGQASGSGDAGEADWDIASPDVYAPSTMGISFCARLKPDGQIVVRLPRERRYRWQAPGMEPFAVNGMYEPLKMSALDKSGQSSDAPAWGRRPAVPADCEVRFAIAELKPDRVIRKDVPRLMDSPIKLTIEVYPRRPKMLSGGWILTVILRNNTEASEDKQSLAGVLFQSHFDVSVQNGELLRYPESPRPFKDLDEDEKSLALLYRDEAPVWGIGHGCAAEWEDPVRPAFVAAESLPTVELPSMTPEIRTEDGTVMRFSMRQLAALDPSAEGTAWQSLQGLPDCYGRWIQKRREIAKRLPDELRKVAESHLDRCDDCRKRIKGGIDLLGKDERVLTAFRLANEAMLLQQIATKLLRRRPLVSDSGQGPPQPEEPHGARTPREIFDAGAEDDTIGKWRPFQLAFLLMSLPGVCNPDHEDRDIVDLIWFPTGGGKTEAYLGVLATYLFHQRLVAGPTAGHANDGTGAIMRYTLRMLTTQQFQRAASLICAMEEIRRSRHESLSLGETRFSLGLWIGGDASPNSIEGATSEMTDFQNGKTRGNPLVLTECPWCRAEIGRFETRTRGRRSTHTPGVQSVQGQGPLLLCPDSRCTFGTRDWRRWLPIEVIDERIFRFPPSVVIATADKFAMAAYRPDARALFGFEAEGSDVKRKRTPPGLIIQDELHLISGPLGTIYALYECIFENLCSVSKPTNTTKPKVIASTATIRSASEQVKSLYGRAQTRLFPAPGLEMGDSFFGAYAHKPPTTTEADAGQPPALAPGRLYLGIHAPNYSSILTTQVRVLSSLAARVGQLAAGERDPWWTILAFYNSIRELGGARTLFDGDIRTRLKRLQNRENVPHDRRRFVSNVQELTSRLSQPEIVQMLDLLSTTYDPKNAQKAIDACLASNIIEVGVDIDRLSLMAVIGQPKSTASYIQVTGRVGRKWWERPGLIVSICNPGKSRDRSHFEHFHGYHRRLYLRVEPTTATPFAISAVKRAAAGALLAYARMKCSATVRSPDSFRPLVEEATQLLRARCEAIEPDSTRSFSLDAIDSIYAELMGKWGQNPQEFEQFPPTPDGEYLMLWPGQYRTHAQKCRGMEIPSSMRQVEPSAELEIRDAYATEARHG